ncbi:MAG: hypothetical protein N3F09_02420 [Bacteroidia bacterium]|nr:hypothetical protein [Bacteroidia bacterium]
MRSVLFFFIFNLFVLKGYSQTYFILKKITTKGNDKTKSYVIKRECPLAENDSVPEHLIEEIRTQTQKNLMRTQLFVYDSVLVNKDLSSRCFTLEIHVKERWYIIPATYVSFLDRNVNAWWLNKDWKRILLGCYLLIDNTTGNKDRLYFHVAYGYNQVLGIVYRFPYLNKKQTLGIRMEYTYEKSGNLHYGIRDNRQLTKYSPFPYLLLGQTSGASVLYRPATLSEHKFNFYHRAFKISDTLLLLQPYFFHIDKNKFSFFNLGYEFHFDQRDNKFNPMQGFSFSLKSDYYFNQTSFRLAIHQISLQYHHAFFKKFIGSFLAAGRNMISENYPGYFFIRGLGYGNYTIRGFEYFIMDGGNYLFGRSTLRYVLLPTRYFKLPFRRLRQFNEVPFSMELTAFADAGKTDLNFDVLPDDIFNKTKIPFGYGFGLQISSYYDFVLRFEYSITPYLKGFYLGFGSGF